MKIHKLKTWDWMINFINLVTKNKIRPSEFQLIHQPLSPKSKLESLSWANQSQGAGLSDVMC